MDDLQHQDVCHYKCHEIGHHQYQYPLNEQQPTSQEVAGPSVDGPLNSQKGWCMCVSYLICFVVNFGATISVIHLIFFIKHAAIIDYAEQ